MRPGSPTAQFGRQATIILRDKNGNRCLRTLIIHGARSVMRCVKKRGDSLGLWLQKIEAHRGFLKTTVALVNKLTRIIWRVLSDGVDFNMQKAVAIN